MSATGARLTAFLLSIAAATSLLVASDSTVATRPLPSVVPVDVASYGTANYSRDHEYLVFRNQVVALGRSNIAVPTLMYHYIRKPPSIRTDRLGYFLSVSPGNFSAQMNWLALRGYHPVDFRDVREYFAGRQPLPAKPVVITFDDGYADLYTTAYPILSCHGFKAVAYIVTGFLKRPGYVTPAQVLEMEGNGIEIASHTVDHADLTRLPAGSLAHQLLDSKRALEHLVGHPVLDFAYPSGRVDAEVVAAVKAAGYSTASTVIYSTDRSPAERYTWGRVRVSGGESLAEFAKDLGTAMPTITTTTIDSETAYVPPSELVMPSLVEIR